MSRCVPRMALMVLLVSRAAPAALAQDDPGRAHAVRERPAVAPAIGAAAVPPDDPWASPEIAAPRMDTPPLKRPVPAQSPRERTDAQERVGSSWLRTLVSLGAVVALIALLSWGYRAIAGSGRLTLWHRFSTGGHGRRATGTVEIVGRTALSARQAICLLRVGSRLVLVGQTPDALSALHVIEDADEVARVLGQAVRQRPGGASLSNRYTHTAEFQRCLEREARDYQPCGTGFQPVDESDSCGCGTGFQPVDESDSCGTGFQPVEANLPDVRHLALVRQRLDDTIQRVRAVAAG